MSMFNDIEWREQGNTDKCMKNSLEVANYARRFFRGHSSFLGPGPEKKWNGTHSEKPGGKWDKTAEHMMIHFPERSSNILCHQSPGRRRTTTQKSGKEVYSLQW